MLFKRTNNIFNLVRIDIKIDLLCVCVYVYAREKVRTFRFSNNSDLLVSIHHKRST